MEENKARWAADPNAFFAPQLVATFTRLIDQFEKRDRDNRAAAAAFLEMSSAAIGEKITDATVPPADAATEAIPSSESVSEGAPQPVTAQPAAGEPATLPAAQAKSIVLPFALAALALVLIAVFILRGAGGRRRT